MDISSLQDTTPTGIDRETMLIQDIIVLEYMLAYIEVATLDLLLYGSDIPHQSLALDQWIMLWV